MRLALAAIAPALLATTVHAESILDKIKDPEDGSIDLSDYLLDHRGALAVPILITEPAVGYGGGVALAWFSESLRDAAQKAHGGRVTPPDIYIAAGFGTDNGTRGAVAAARLSFGEDRWRYRGALGAPKVNLDFYGVGGELAPNLDKIGYTLKGWGTFQELTRRVGESDHFIGLRWLYGDLEASLTVDASSVNVTPRELANRNSELGAIWTYDSRDNILTTRTGLQAGISANFADPAFGADHRFQAYRAFAYEYLDPSEKIVMPLRAEVRAARGEVPLYRLPYVELRGIPALRYQDENAGVLEAEARYYVTPRWIGVAFLGAGRAWGRDASFGDTPTRVAKGVGFRYVIARRLGLSMGIDVARGPEGGAWYISVGNTWR